MGALSELYKYIRGNSLACKQAHFCKNKMNPENEFMLGLVELNVFANPQSLVPQDDLSTLLDEEVLRRIMDSLNKESGSSPTPVFNPPVQRRTKKRGLAGSEQSESKRPRLSVEHLNVSTSWLENVLLEQVLLIPRNKAVEFRNQLLREYPAFHPSMKKRLLHFLYGLKVTDRSNLYQYSTKKKHDREEVLQVI